MSDTITKQEPKLSVRKPGAWRNVWRVDEPILWACGSIDDEGEYIDKQGWLSMEMAEQKATEHLRELAISDPGIEIIFHYVGPVFFPEGEDA